MGKYVQTMADHWQKLFACVIFVLITQVHSQGNDEVSLTIVDGAVEKRAVCIDGSPAGYHYAPGFGEGVNNWLVFLMGGGWCTEKYTCRLRMGTFIGSTTNITTQFFGGILSSNQDINPDFYNWNRVYVRYCDGSSFIGDTEVFDSETNRNFQFRGSRIFSAVMDELLAKGMSNANNAILAGCSAGGLATILNCDGFRTLIPTTSRVKCISDAGFFIRAKDLPWADYRERVFAKTIEFHNLTTFLPTSCTSRMNSSLCLFPENLVGDIQTPLFLLNSAFDIFQIQVNLKPYPADLPGWDSCAINTHNCTPAQTQLIKDFGGAFLEALKEIGDNPSRGMFINSCYNHCYSESSATWNSDVSPRLENKTISQAISDWYFDRGAVQLIDNQSDFPLNCTMSYISYWNISHN